MSNTFKDAIWRATKMKTNYEKRLGDANYDISSYGPWTDGLWLTDNWKQLNSTQDTISNVVTDPSVIEDLTNFRDTLDLVESTVPNFPVEKGILSPSNDVGITLNKRAIIGASALLPKLRRLDIDSARVPEADIMFGIDRVGLENLRQVGETNAEYYESVYFPSVRYYTDQIHDDYVSIRMPVPSQYEYVINYVFIDGVRYAVNIFI